MERLILILDFSLIAFHFETKIPWTCFTKEYLNTEQKTHILDKIMRKGISLTHTLHLGKTMHLVHPFFLILVL